VSDERKPGLPRREALRITAVAGISLVLGGGLFAEVLRQAGLYRARVTRTQLGTLVTITAVHPDKAGAHVMVDKAFAEIERLESVLSRYRSDTPLARLNRDRVLHGAPEELTLVLGRALEYGKMTGGAFDVTVAPLVDLYKAHFAGTDVPPPDAQVDRARSLVDYRAVRVEGDDLFLDRPGASITLDGIAKGYVVDRAVAALMAAGAERVLVAASGDMAPGAVAGSEEPWRIAVQDPRSEGSLGVLALEADCIASSGDYEQAYTRDLRYNHIIDPRTGRSPENTSGVTVVGPPPMDAAAMATASFVLGPSEGVAFLERLDGVEGMVISKDQQQFRTRGFNHYLA
jgi:thiamine biosynthesis lipoprotein